jgi:hypothetical protein
LYLYFSQYSCQLLEEYSDSDSEEEYIPAEAAADGQTGEAADSLEAAEAAAAVLEDFPAEAEALAAGAQAEDGSSSNVKF